MKKQFAIRLEEQLEADIKQLWWWSLVKWIEYLYTKRQESDGIHCIPSENIEYSDMVNLFKQLAELLKKHKPQAQSNDGIQDGIQNSKIDKLKQIVSWNIQVQEIKSDYTDLYNSLTPIKKMQLYEIIKATSKWNFREEGEEYTRKQLLEKRWFNQFVGLI